MRMNKLLYYYEEKHGIWSFLLFRKKINQNARDKTSKNIYNKKLLSFPAILYSVLACTANLKIICSFVETRANDILT
jgi:hypothetical protein